MADTRDSEPYALRVMSAQRGGSEQFELSAICQAAVSEAGDHNRNQRMGQQDANFPGGRVYLTVVRNGERIRQDARLGGTFGLMSCFERVWEVKSSKAGSVCDAEKQKQYCNRHTYCPWDVVGKAVVVRIGQ